MTSKTSLCRVLILTGIAFFLGSQSVSAKSANTVKVFLLGGQSNMLGFGGKTADLKEPYKDPLSKI